MKTSDIVQLKRDITTALGAAGRGEMGWYIFVEKMDDLGYDIVQRPPASQPERVSQIGWIEPPASNGLLGHAPEGELLIP
jgi:hypothetical protein